MAIKATGTVRTTGVRRFGPVLAAVRPLFEQLLADREWLPEEFQLDAPASGMGGGIGQWLLYRAADRSLCLFSLVVPPGAKTPIHDHLAWGLIGLYRGNQDEEFYRPGDGMLELVRQRPLEPGDLYALLPPRERHPLRPHDLGRDVRLDPPACERHGLRPPAHLRRAHGSGVTVSGRAT